MTDCNVRECWDCGSHWPEDVMKKGADENWHCQECYYPDPEPDIVDFARQKLDR